MNIHLKEWEKNVLCANLAKIYSGYVAFGIFEFGIQSKCRQLAGNTANFMKALYFILHGFKGESS